MKMHSYVFAIIVILLLITCLSACVRPASTAVIEPEEEPTRTFDTTVPTGYDAHRDGVDYGAVQALEYDSTVSGGKKHASVLLPAGYDAAKSYPVVFIYPGHFSDHTYWLSDLNAAEIVGNLMHEGKLAECIVVFVNFFMSPDETPDNVLVFGHDSSPDDLVNCLYPALQQTYSVKTGKPNTAVAGYSAGGRATLNVVLQYGDFADYALACEPFYYDETKCVPAGKTLRSFLVVKGAKDGIVLDAPYRAHLDLQKYHVDHTYLELDYGHEADCWKQSLYLFLNTIFKE